jgi:predicted ATPase
VETDRPFRCGLLLELQQAREGALFWELRSAMSLARLRVKQDRPNDARQILAPVYDRFTEGFETADLHSARSILDSLPTHPTGLEI